MGKVIFKEMVLVAGIALLVVPAFAGEGQVTQVGKVMVYTQPETASTAAGEGINYSNALPMPMPTLDTAPVDPFNGGIASQSTGTPGFEPGFRGNGVTLPKTTAADEPLASPEGISSANGFESSEYGVNTQPYTTMRVDLTGNIESKNYPNRAAGKLYFNDGATTYVCSASLIKRGVVVTAAHCVAKFGEQRYYSNWRFVPAMSGTLKPYGEWAVSSAQVLAPYYNGTDYCFQKGVVCKNDVAVLVLTPQAGAYPGTNTGWLGYGWDGFGFTPNNLALITQLGYPVSHDAGTKMQRTDSQGFVSTMSKNTVIGSRQTGGSSGGPWVVNLGIAPVLSGGVTVGQEGTANTVVGATSWGYIDNTIKQQGASSFLSTNIVRLVDAACAAYPAACN